MKLLWIAILFGVLLFVGCISTEETVSDDSSPENVSSNQNLSNLTNPKDESNKIIENTEEKPDVDQTEENQSFTEFVVDILTYTPNDVIINREDIASRWNKLDSQGNYIFEEHLENLTDEKTYVQIDGMSRQTEMNYSGVAYIDKKTNKNLIILVYQYANETWATNAMKERSRFYEDNNYQMQNSAFVDIGDKRLVGKREYRSMFNIDICTYLVQFRRNNFFIELSFDNCSDEALNEAHEYLKTMDSEVK
jgi:PBP1b-binding outer membrane lipoprotein LpoB